MKEKQIRFAIVKIQEILNNLSPGNDWKIIYTNNSEAFNLSNWDKEYHRIYQDEEYFLIFNKERLLYAVNVTGERPIFALSELMNLLGRKF